MTEIETLRPVFVIAPYLPLGAVHAIGPWRLLPPETADVRWIAPWVREHVEAFLPHFVDVHGRPVEHPTLVHRAGSRIRAPASARRGAHLP
jgi:hypothetical protein